MCVSEVELVVNDCFGLIVSKRLSACLRQAGLTVVDGGRAICDVPYDAIRSTTTQVGRVKGVSVVWMFGGVEH